MCESHFLHTNKNNILVVHLSVFQACKSINYGEEYFFLIESRFLFLYNLLIGRQTNFSLKLKKKSKQKEEKQKQN